MKLPTVLRWILWPASLLYEVAVRLRAWCYRRGIFRQRRLNSVVLSVGNLTVGGTGKTPMVIWMAQRLRKEGKRVGILTRGYKGSEGASDEVMLMRSYLDDSVLIGVGPDRYAEGRELEKDGVQWILMDDGYQHLQLARHVDIVLIDASEPFGGGLLLPAGRLREPRRALFRADIVVITRADHTTPLVAGVRRYTTAPIFYSYTEFEGVARVGANIGEEKPEAWREERLFGFCGIGNPQAFFSDCDRWGITLMGTRAFRDHHRYSQRDADELEHLGASTGSSTALLCTEKDVFNLDRVRFKYFPVYYCRMALRVENEQRFWRAVLDAVERNRRKVVR